MAALVTVDKITNAGTVVANLLIILTGGGLQRTPLLPVNAIYEAVSQQLEVQPKPQRRLTMQMDELWSFVDDKGNEQWVWLAIDAVSREIVGCCIGDRSGASAQKLWES